MSILRTIAMFIYLFGYMILHYGILRRAERAAAAGDTATVEQIVNQHHPHSEQIHPCINHLRRCRVPEVVKVHISKPSLRGCGLEHFRQTPHCKANRPLCCARNVRDFSVNWHNAWLPVLRVIQYKAIRIRSCAANLTNSHA